MTPLEPPASPESAVEEFMARIPPPLRDDESTTELMKMSFVTGMARASEFFVAMLTGQLCKASEMELFLNNWRHGIGKEIERGTAAVLILVPDDDSMPHA
jgi:hypothetical protein